MQNKANLPNVQMNISFTLTMYYENKRLCRRGENKPKQTQTNSKRVGWGLYPTNSSAAP